MPEPLPPPPVPSSRVPPHRYVLLGRYRLDSLIAVGGMGQVWRAVDMATNQLVAVKMLRAEVAEHPEWRERMHREATYASLMAHRGVARQFGYHDGSDGTPPFIVMEFVDAPSLGDVLKAEGSLPPRHVLSIIDKTADALEGAHAVGVVHRDLKPDNLLLAGRDVKLIDFGVAWSPDTSAMTHHGTMVGTPHYMSPEQVAGLTVSPLSDLYSLGIIAYQCLAGHLPFEGSVVTVAVAHRDQPLPELPAGVPAPIADLVRALTQKDPGDRPESGTVVSCWARRLLASPSPSVGAVAESVAGAGAVLPAASTKTEGTASDAGRHRARSRGPRHSHKNGRG